MTKYIFVTGGVVSGLGKGITAASLGRLLKARGLNDSITHVDIMVGTPDLSITGLTHDGREIPVFIDGNFAPNI